MKLAPMTPPAAAPARNAEFAPPQARGPRAVASEPMPGTERIVRDRIRESAEQLVADALITPFLSQLRESVGQFSDEKSVFKQTDAEKRLGPVVDAGVADTLITRTKWPLVDRVEESLLSRAGLKPLGAPIRTAPSEARR